MITITKLKIELWMNEIVLIVTIKQDILSILRNKRKPDFNKRVNVIKQILKENRFIKRVIIKIGNGYISDEDINTLIDTICDSGIYPSHIFSIATGLIKNERIIDKLDEHVLNFEDGIYEQIKNSNIAFSFNCINPYTLIIDCSNITTKSSLYKDIDTFKKCDDRITDILLLFNNNYDDYSILTNKLKEFEETFVNIVYKLLTKSSIKKLKFKIIIPNNFYAVYLIQQYVEDMLKDTFRTTHLLISPSSGNSPESGEFKIG